MHQRSCQDYFAADYSLMASTTEEKPKKERKSWFRRPQSTSPNLEASELSESSTVSTSSTPPPQSLSPQLLTYDDIAQAFTNLSLNYMGFRGHWNVGDKIYGTPQQIDVAERTVRNLNK